MKPTPKPAVYFGLREHLMSELPGAAPGEAAPTLRSGPMPLARGVSVAAVALMNMALLAGAAEAQTPVPVPARKKADTTGAVGETELPEVVVVGRGDEGAYRAETASLPKYTEPLRDVPQTVTVVPEAVIKDQGATTLREVLRNVPGISIQAGEGGVPAGDNLSIRGFNARTDLFVDGVRDIGGYARDPFNFEQIEVVKGPASAYSGRGSTGGSINLDTKTPRQTAFYRGDAGVGTDSYRRFTLDVNQPILSLWPKPTLAAPGGKDGKELTSADPEPTVAVRLNAMWTESDIPNRDEVGGRRWGVAPSIAFGLGTPTTFTFTYMHMEQENVPDYGIPWVPETNNALLKSRGKIAPVEFSNYYGILDRDYENIVTDIGTFEVKHAFNDSHSLRYLMRYGQNTRDSMITAPRFLNDDTTSIRRQLQSRDQQDVILANLINYTASFATWGLHHTLVAGVEYDRETQENQLREGPEAPLADLLHPDPHVSYPGSVRRTGAVNEAEAETLSLFAFDTVKLGKHWLLSGGLRYDYFSVDYDSKDATDVTTTLGRIDKHLSWRAALSYKPVESGTIYAAYGTSFNPSTQDLTSGFNINNAALEPEKSRTIEVGTKWDFFENRFSLNVAAFRTEKTNARTAQLPGEPLLVLDGEQTVQGIEIGVAGNLTRDWAVFGGYTFLDSEIEKSNTPAEVGRELPNTPQHSFSLWTTYQLPWKIQVGAGAQYVASRFANVTNTREADSYWTFDAMLKYEVTENIDIQVNVYNLADEEYLSALGGGHAMPGPGRSATVTASFHF